MVEAAYRPQKMTQAQNTAVSEVVGIEDKKDCSNEEWRAVGETIAASIRAEGVTEITIPAEPDEITAFALYLQGCYEARKTFKETFIEDGPSAAGVPGINISLDEDDEQDDEPEEKPEVSGWEYCSECGDLAVDKTKLVGCEDDFEFYCDCGHAWWGSG